MNYVANYVVNYVVDILYINVYQFIIGNIKKYFIKTSFKLFIPSYPTP
jgi:hypothetical protein